MQGAGYDMAAKELPERDRDGTYFWQHYAERLESRFGGVPSSEGGGTFADECLAAGARAVPVARRNGLWERDAPRSSDKEERAIYELRVRLGLFFAASLRCLVQGAARLRVNCGDEKWKAVSEDGESFRDFAARQDGEVDVKWVNSAPGYGATSLVTTLFFTAQEALLLSPELAEQVYEHVGPEGPAGLFGMMLVAEGQAERFETDVAGVFLEAVAQSVDRRVVQLNDRANGHVFITPEFWLLTAPKGVDCVRDFLRTRKEGRRYEFSRREIYLSLSAAGHVAGGDGTAGGNATWICQVDVIGWDKPLELYGLPIRVEALPLQPTAAPVFDGTVTLKRENEGGNDTGQS